MINQKINRNLLPNIRFDGEVYSLENDVSPLAQVLNKIEVLERSEKRTISLFLTAAGGIGKSTTLRALWLDFLMGKFEKPCVYIDLKLLSEDGKNAIQNYLKDKYKLSVNDNGVKPILLLDGANEAAYPLREGQQNEDCALVRECKKLMDSGFRIVISSRSKYITEKEENKKEEFDSSEMQYCELCELTDKQVNSVDVKEETGSVLFNLLKNNFMLSIYKELSQRDKEEVKQKPTAGQLLDLYFTKCFKVRYILNSDAKLLVKFDEENLEKEIERIHSESKCPKLFDRDIIYCEGNFEKIFDFLIANAINAIIEREKLEEHLSYYVDVFEHLSILQKNSEGDYVWANEIYQEYFIAKRYATILEKVLIEIKQFKVIKEQYSNLSEAVLEDKLRNCANLLASLTDQGYFGPVYNNQREFRILQYAGELSCISVDDINAFDGLLKFDKELKRLIAIVSVLCLGVFPSSIDRIDDLWFENCDLLTSISIPSTIKHIGYRAFAECSNLTQIKFEGGVINIGVSAFSACDHLRDIQISNSVLEIGAGAFEFCTDLKNVSLPIELNLQSYASDGISDYCKADPSSLDRREIVNDNFRDTINENQILNKHKIKITKSLKKIFNARHDYWGEYMQKKRALSSLLFLEALKIWLKKRN